MDFFLTIIEDDWGRGAFHNGMTLEEFKLKDDGSESFKVSLFAFEDEMRLHANGYCCND